MLYQLLNLLPKDLSTTAMGVAIAAVVLGLALWVSGARFSQALLTLVAVAAGSLVGLQVPHWTGWAISTWATAIAGALALGACAYLGHRYCVCAALGTVMACWAALGVWAYCGVGAAWNWPACEGAWPGYFATLWQSLPASVAQALPYACGTAFIMGAGLGFLWPRLCLVSTYSAWGVSLALAGAMALLIKGKPEWLSRLPNKTTMHIGVLLGLMLIGALVQWRVAGLTRKEPARKAPD